MSNPLHFLLLVRIVLGFTLSNVPLPIAHYPFFLKILLMWISGNVVVGCWIAPTSLLGYAKVCRNWMNKYFNEYSK